MWGHPHAGLEPALNDLILTSSSAKTFFPSKVTLPGAGVRTSASWGELSSPPEAEGVLVYLSRWESAGRAYMLVGRSPRRELLRFQNRGSVMPGGRSPVWVWRVPSICKE